MPTGSDVERQPHNAVPDKPAPGNADAQPRKNLAHRVIPASRGARFLCIGTILVVLVLLITFLAFWFSADALFIVPVLRTTIPGKNVDPAQWTRDGTVIRSVPNWIIDMSVENRNKFAMTIEDLGVTAKFVTRENRTVLFGKSITRQSRVTVHVPAKEETKLKIELDVHWDLSDREQAYALKSLLVLCGVSASNVPAAPNVPDELPDFTGSKSPPPGFMKWEMGARKVTGFLGLGMTPPPGELVVWDQVHGAASGWGGRSPNAQEDWIMVAVCPWLMGNRTATPPQDIVRLAILTMQACKETEKCH
ncbi:hypothetical protein AMAG_16525 [Allomyces macrogynus ATCC 38327]|uniref:Uncharacterized protein n=1 Tax=Allomyces macrogynus (strain ATCC 38327) TaxID=578462 RepID=A0A0L0TCT3_ALLM3|nr:hypothetical protein AMAG_16525 [Allomyces macrogynus ATCC 38327]|eukprot:KNE72481.1 hypothetical protein AMAG_16525 [Allomyces macrogynus ATCC 38327]